MRYAPLGLAALLIASACEDEQIARVEPTLIATPMVIDLGDVVVGTVARVDLTLKNDGQGMLNIKSSKIDDALAVELTMEGAVDQLIAGKEAYLALSFAPTSVGERSGTIRFETDSNLTPTVVVQITGRGVDPPLVANPPVIDFGRVVVGQTRSATVTLTNTGSEVLTLIRASNDMGTSAEIAPTLARQELAPGASTTLVVSYSPIDLGPDEGRILIIDTSRRPTSLAIRVRGLGVASDIEVEPLTLTFNGLYVGQMQTQPFFIRNIGDRPHQVTDLALESGGAVFVVTGTATPFTLNPGEAAHVDVTYAPSAAGMHTDRVRVGSTGLPSAVFVSLNGVAGDAPVPEIDVMPAMVEFGQVEVGMNRTLGVRLTNVGTADLRIDGLDAPASPYTLASLITPAAVFAPRDSQEVQITFAPTAAGPAPAAELVIRSTDPTRPTVRVPINGEGTVRSFPIIRVTPNPVDFGRVPRGTNASRSITLFNDGSAPLIISNVRLSNDAMGRFLLPTPPAAGTTIAGGQNIQLSVGYLDNGVVATYNGQLQVLSNDPANATVNVALTAQTEPPPVTSTDIAILMRWTGTADIDLHLVRPNSSFFNIPGDVCYCNTNPDWAMVNNAVDNPFLDRDDLVGPGPENINLSQAESGDYQVIAHYFGSASGASISVTMEINLAGTRAASVVRSLGTNDKWIAGTITWNAATRTGTWRAGILPPFPTLTRFCQ